MLPFYTCHKFAQFAAIPNAGWTRELVEAVVQEIKAQAVKAYPEDDNLDPWCEAAAVELIAQAARFRDSNPLYQCKKGSAFFKQGRFDEAVTCYRKALGLEPDCAEAYVRNTSQLWTWRGS